MTRINLHKKAREDLLTIPTIATALKQQTQAKLIKIRMTRQPTI